jgi:AcrR family transcriptional regulator
MARARQSETRLEHRSTSSKHAAADLSVRERLLDAAEALFADHGFHGAPMRDITSRAGTRLADINDHFGSKERLFQEVIARRAILINIDRYELLTQIPSSLGKMAEIRGIVEAFSAPLLARSMESQGWRNYLRLLSQLTNTRSLVLLLIAEHFNPIGEAFIERMGQALPQLSRRQRLIAYQLLVASATAVFSDNRRIDVMSNGTERSADFSVHYKDMISFVAGGILHMSDN